LHGNAAEWTSTAIDGRQVVRGGSFHDRPQRATSFVRVSYPARQKVYNVGFRVACEAEPAPAPQQAANQR
jgi:formylglycine-generating enzyme required for sulfatase activity